MTKGIIQQTFEKHTRELCKSEYFDEVMFSNYKCLERELIEKIKHICDKQLEEQEEYPDMIDRWTLIGDNQE